MENTKLFHLELIGKNYGNIIQTIRAGNSCSIFGAQNSMRPAVINAISLPTIYLTADSITANHYSECFNFMGVRTGVFPTITDSFLYKKSVSVDLYRQRTLLLYKILTNQIDVVVAPVDSLISFLPSALEFKKSIIVLNQNEVINQSDLEKKLIFAGYKREELISEPGQFSKRGEIFDIFPINSEYPFRIDFFDNQIETIKIFDITSQKGTKDVKKIEICPCTDLFFKDDEIQKIIASLEKIKVNKQNDDVDLSVIFNSQVDEIISRIELNDRSYSLDCISSYIDNFKSSVFDYMSFFGKFVIAIDESKQVYDYLQNSSKETSSRLKELAKSNTLISGKNKSIFSFDEILSNFEKNTCIAFLKITNSNRFFNSKAVFSVKSIPSNRFTHNLRDFSMEVRTYKLKDYKIIICAGNDEQSQSIKNILLSHDINIDICKKINFKSKSLEIVSVGYETGFILPDEKIYVVGTYDIFPKKQKSNKLKSGQNFVFNIPKVGDYVVHEFHGIGICAGVTKLTGNFGTKDYVVIKYRDDDTLYVPTSQMDLLSKFTGADKPKKLSKIGGQEFSAVKERVKASIKKLAFSLIELYAKRENMRGYAFSEDNDLQREFENSFPYTETEDQLNSIAEIKKDMEKPKVMDRLLCGDVGFGKTEVALRACFKAIMDGKQVAFVAPTTILSEQHFNTAKSRMYNFGVNIEVLNRFKTKKQQEEILSRIASGDVDLVCGTHRIFSKDVEFKNLGLIVLDEEQKFGVEDKEKLKNKYPFIDSLTLSATPIPRTLNMSLSGIRDISVITTPPSERLPIQTYITEYSDSLIKDAITRELTRDGQVFVLFNSVEKIYGFAEKIKKIVPEAIVSIAHGQMSSRELENTIYEFYNKKSNVLVCTTIIENGIDIENANTLIIIDSDKLGLSQLYQIRGRVGRGAKMAYAYFTYEYSKVLTEDAYKRLDAMSEFCEFGSGFKLAMRDLEIRGGGDILGAEQSGHLQKIGYDMYSKLLSETISELKGEKYQTKKDVLVRVAIDAYVPDTYVATSEDRMVVYRRISGVENLEMVEKLKTELFDTYGEIPKVVLNLIDIALVRKLASKLGAIEVSSLGAEVDIVFEKREDITENEVIGESIFSLKGICSLDFSTRPLLKFIKNRLCSENFKDTRKFLLETQKVMSKITNNLKK